MKRSGIELRKLMGILRQAYQEKEDLPIGTQWQNSVMVRIRHMGPPGSDAAYLPTFEHLVWRLAPASSLLMIGLSALSYAMSSFFEYDLFQLFLNGVEDSAVAHLFGM